MYLTDMTRLKAPVNMSTLSRWYMVAMAPPIKVRTCANVAFR